MDDQGRVHYKVPLLSLTVDLATIPEISNACIMKDGSYNSILVSK